MTVLRLVREESSVVWQALFGSLMIALLAQVTIPLYFTPVPLTGQTLGVMLAGLLLGPRGGFWAVFAYLAEGAMGLPVFAGGMSSAAVLFGLKGGYYWAFLLQAYLVGVARARFWPLLAISMVQLAIGTLWLSFFVGASAWGLGFTPFLIGETLKILVILQFFRRSHA